jgi:arylsulfatase A-like enzyme
MEHFRSHSRFAALSRSARYLPAVIVLIVVCVASTACRRPQATQDLGAIENLQPLIDRFTPAQSVVVVPDRFWETDDDQQTWVFRGYANLLCHVEETPDEGLRLLFESTQATSSFHFTASWDGEPLWETPRRLAAPREVLEIEPDRLAPGLHRLELRRVAAADDPADRSHRNNSFSGVAFEFIDTAVRLDPSRADRYEFIRAFLEDGVTGVGIEKFGGWLTSSPGTTSATVTLDEDSVASFDLVSFEPTPSRFFLVVDGEEHTVEVAGGSKRLEVELPRGTHRLDLSVRGGADAYHLWGAPHLRTAKGKSAGPVIVVTMDTTRWDALSLYGGPEAASPNLAGLAERATVFDNAWSTSPWTLPSHASIFTGLYPSHHGAGVMNPRLERRFVTLAEIFRQSGYRTAGFAGGELSASYWGVAQGFELYRDPEGFETRGDRLTAAVEHFLEGIGDDPFFLFVNYFDPHGLYQAPREFEELFGVAKLRERIEALPLWGELSRGDSSVWRAIIAGEAEVNADAIAYMRAAYLAEVAFMDHQIGRLVEWLEQRELFDAATIVLVADHGEFLGEHGFFSHACRLDPELTRVPLIIKWPDQRERGLDKGLVSQVDLFTTLAAVAGSEAPVGDGLSLDGALRPELAKRNAVFMEEHEMRIHPLFANMRIASSVFGIQQLDFRQVVWRGGTTCYRANRGDWREARCTVDWTDRMEQLEAFIDHSVGDAGPADEHDLSEEMRRRLEALGYVR